MNSTMPDVNLPVAYLLNAALVVVVISVIARARFTNRPWLRIALLSLFLLIDATALIWLDCSMRALAFFAWNVCVASISFREEQTRPLVCAFGGLTFPVYIASVFTVAILVHIHLPVTTFLTSPGEIGVHLEYLLTANARATMVVTYLAALLYAFAISPRMKAVLALQALVLLALTVLYAYVYPLGYPVMNGLMFEQIPIESAELVLRGLADAVTVMATAVLCSYAVLKLPARKILLAILFLNVSLGLAAGITIARDTVGDTVGHTEGDSAAASSERPIRYAKGSSNVLIIFLDRFMGGFVEPILEQEPQLASALDGFTWYPRTIAAGQNSIAGLHPLLGGYDYTPREMNKRDQPLRELSAESFGILPYNFTRSGYDANFVNPHGLGFTMEGDCSFLDIEGLNCTHIPAAITKKVAEEHGVPMQVLAKSSYADLLVLLGLMRTAPYLGKAVLRERGPWRPFLDHSAGTTFKEWAELGSLPELSMAEADRGNLNIIFNNLPHEPYFMGEDCVPRTTPLTLSRDELRRRGHQNMFEMQHFVAARCALLLVSDYLRWMKQAGVYDDTKIVVVSDHGIVGTVEDRSSRAVAGGTTDNLYVRSRSLLLVKDRGAKGPLRVSEEFMPNAEVPRIVCEEIGGCVNPHLDDRPIAAHGRDNPFHVTIVPWQFNLQERNAFRVEHEFVVLDRDPYDAKRWRDAKPSE